MPGADDFDDLDAELAGDQSMEDDGSPAPPKKETASTRAGTGDAAPPPGDAESAAAERTDPNIRIDELSADSATDGGEHNHEGTPPQAGVPTPQDYYAACAGKTQTGTALAPQHAPTAQDYYAACAATQKKEGGK